MLETSSVIPPRPYDSGFARIVSKITHPCWMLDLPVSILARFFAISKARQTGIYPAITKTTIVSKHLLELEDEEISGRIGISKPGKIRVIFSAAWFSENRIHKTIGQQGLFLSAMDLKPIKIPTETISIIDAKDP